MTTPRLLIRVRRGIAGYVLKNASAAELLDAVRAVAKDSLLPTEVCRVLFQESRAK